MRYGPWRAVLQTVCPLTYDFFFLHSITSFNQTETFEMKKKKKKKTVRERMSGTIFSITFVTLTRFRFVSQCCSTTASVARQWVRLLYFNQDFHGGIFVKYLVLMFVCVGCGPYQTFFQLSSLDTKWTRQFLLNEVTDSIRWDTSHISAT